MTDSHSHTGAEALRVTMTTITYYVHQNHKSSSTSHNLGGKKKISDAIAVIVLLALHNQKQQQLVHGDVDGALVDAVLRRLLLVLLLGRGQLGVPGLRLGTSAFAVAVEAAGVAARPWRARGDVALRRGVGRLQCGRRLPPTELRRLGPGRGQLLVLGLGGRRLVVEAWHRVGLECQALPQQFQSLLLFFLQVKKMHEKQTNNYFSEHYLVGPDEFLDVYPWRKICRLWWFSWYRCDK